MSPPSPKIIRIDQRTGRPDSVYPKREGDSKIYTDEFSRALRLKPTPTMFGNKVVKI
jgi:hypothetical protein